MAEPIEQVRLAGSVLGRSCHVCAFFHSKEEEYEVLMPFIKEGIERGDRAFHVVDAKLRAAHLQRLEQEGIDVAGAQSKGQLEVRRWDEAYIKDARFDQYRMIDTIKDALDPAAIELDQTVQHPAAGLRRRKIEEGRELVGFDHHFVKPLEPDALEKLLSGL